jgi:AraC-like DNA-binding protein
LIQFKQKALGEKMSPSLKFILEQLSFKYDIPLLVHCRKYHKLILGKEIFKINYETLAEDLAIYPVKYYLFENQIYSSFSFYSEGRDYFIIIGPSKIFEKIEEIESYTFNMINVTSRKDFLSFIDIIYNLTKSQKLPEPPSWLSTKISIEEINILSKKNIILRRLYDPDMDSIEFEKRFLAAIRENEPYKISWMVRKVSSTYNAKLSKDNLVSVKYRCVGIIVLMSRVSINNGVSTLDAYALSDSLLQELEKTYNYEDCLIFIEKASFLFIDLIHEYPFKNNSDLVRKIINYIDTHIYSKITIPEISSTFQKHETLITSKFKSETGQTIHNFITQKKIEESKHLLVFTDKSVKEIAMLLSYSSHSHFIQVFKAKQGITPSNYRELHGINHLNVIDESTV